jgi:hypothetical protein
MQRAKIYGEGGMLRPQINMKFYKGAQCLPSLQNRFYTLEMIFVFDAKGIFL